MKKKNLKIQMSDFVYFKIFQRDFSLLDHFLFISETKIFEPSICESPAKIIEFGSRFWRQRAQNYHIFQNLKLKKA